MLRTFSATATIQVRGFVPARDSEGVARVLGAAIGQALAAAVQVTTDKNREDQK